MKKKKILVLVDWFTPGYKAGGPIQSCVNFAFAMKDEFSIHVLTTDTDHGETTPYRGIRAGVWTTDLDPDIRVHYLEKKKLTAARLRRQIRDVDPDFIYLNHLFSPLFVIYPLWLQFTGRLNGRVIICPRGALYDSALAVRSWKKAPFLRLFRWMGVHRRVRFHATNERERDAILSFFPGSDIRIADNLPRMNQPPFMSVPKRAGAVRVIYVARLVAIKNLLYMLKALAQVGARVELTVVGPVEDKAYWEECRKAIDGLPPNISVEYLGPKRNDELMPLLQQHHIFVLPTMGENFGHSIFEALLAGRPVLISDQTPWLGLTARKAGWDLPLSDPAGFGRVVEETAAWEQGKFDEWARSAWEFAHKFVGNPELQSQYIQLFA